MLRKSGLPQRGALPRARDIFLGGPGIIVIEKSSSAVIIMMIPRVHSIISGCLIPSQGSTTIIPMKRISAMR